MVETSPEESFTSFVNKTGSGLKQALIASMGGEAGQEAAAEALAYGWEHWERLRKMDNPAGYLYRVGLTRGLPPTNDGALFSLPASVDESIPWIEPRLPRAVSELSDRQRTVVMLIHGFGWTHRETADLLGLSPGTVQRHLERGMRRLRRVMRVSADA